MVTIEALNIQHYETLLHYNVVSSRVNRATLCRLWNRKFLTLWSALYQVLQVREEQLVEIQRCLDSQEMADSHGKQFLSASAYPLLSFGMELSMIEWEGCKVALTPEFIATLSVDSAKRIWLVREKLE